MEPKEYGRIAAAEEDHWWYLHTRAIMRDFTRAWVGSGGRALDAGCGPGGNSAWLAEEGPVFGIDLSPDALAYARSRWPLTRLARGSVTALPFAPASFDVVVVTTVLYQVQDHSRAAAEIARVLRPGGATFILEPALPLLRRSHDDAVRSVRRYRLQELVGLVEAAGLAVRRATYVHAYLLPAALALAAVYRLRRPQGGESRSDLDRARMGVFVTALTKLERTLLARHDLPLGVSAVVVATRDAAPPGVGRSGHVSLDLADGKR